MRVGPAPYRDRAGQPLTEVFEQVGGAKILGDEDEAAQRRGRRPGTGEPFDDPSADLPYVGGAFAQHLVRQRLQHPGVLLDRVVDAVQRVVSGGRPPGGVHQARVGGDHRADRDDVGHRPPALGPGPVRDPVQVTGHVPERLLDPVRVQRPGAEFALEPGHGEPMAHRRRLGGEPRVEAIGGDGRDRDGVVARLDQQRKR